MDVDSYILIKEINLPYVNKVTIVEFGDQEVDVKIIMKGNIQYVDIKKTVINGKMIIAKIIMNLSFIKIRSLNPLRLKKSYK